MTHHAHKHGGFGTPEYRAWQQLLQRCLNPKHAAFPKYGGRGIGVHPDWQTDFAAFLRHVGPRPSPRHSIDRIDNGRGYEPGNVRWATKIEQARNRRTNRLLTVRGETRPISEWTERLGVSENTIRERLRRGWASERAVSESSRATCRACGAAGGAS